MEKHSLCKDVIMSVRAYSPREGLWPSSSLIFFSVGPQPDHEHIGCSAASSVGAYMYIILYKSMMQCCTYTVYIYRVIHTSLRDFRTRLRNNQDRHGRKEHINRQRTSPRFFLYQGPWRTSRFHHQGVVVKKDGVHSE